MSAGGRDFIREIVEDDLHSGRTDGRVVTRFPPEPNGYLHIGHAKSICLNFGVAEEYGGRCNLRFDDTNPLMESEDYVQAIERDVHWLGFSYGDRALYASDYFSEMYELAEELIQKEKAYVDDSPDEEVRELRGALGVAARPSPFRDRTPTENLERFRAMRSGAFPDGACVLRAKIDLANPNMKMRDPLLYRVRHATHHRTGDEWPIYPLYDWAHPISDAVEGITHSLCTLEFENNRELYDWVIDATGVSERHGFTRPHQYEFARLNLDYTVMSKRRLLALVESGQVAGWDDPRMPTISGMRRRGYTPDAIRAFADLVGVAKVNSSVDLDKLDFCVREDLNRTAPRVLGVLDPLPVTITSWPEGTVEELVGPYFPADVGLPGERLVPFGREILIDRADFALEPPPGWHRLAPGLTVRLRHGPCITCEEAVVKDGRVVELRCSHVPGSVGTNPPGVKVSGVIHWVHEGRSVGAEARVYERLFLSPHPEDGDPLNAESRQVMAGARLEASLAGAEPGSRWQLERVGYFVVDAEESGPDALVLNRVVGLRDSWEGRPAPVAPPAVARSEQEKSEREASRPVRRTPREYRAEGRARDPLLAERFETWPSAYGLDPADADLLTGERPTGDLFEAAVGRGGPPAAVARWIINEVPRALGGRPLGETALTGDGLGRLVAAVEAGRLQAGPARQVLAELVERGGDVEAMVEQRGSDRVDDEGLVAILVDQIIGANPAEVAEYRAGKVGLLGFFIGQVVRASDGNADPQLARRVLEARLG